MKILALPHPGPLPLGEGESSSDGLKRRAIIPVPGPDACSLLESGDGEDLFLFEDEHEDEADSKEAE